MSREDEYRAIFCEEMREHLEKIEELLLKLKSDPNNKEWINDLFRSVHTIKGSSAAMGYTRTADLVHAMEDIIQAVRDGRSAITSGKLEVFLSVYDLLAQTLEVIINVGNDESIDSGALLKALTDLKNEKEEKKDPPDEKPQQKQIPGGLALGEAEIELLKEKQKSGMHLIGVFLKSEADSAFKNVRAWMALTEIEKHGEIIAATPTKEQLDANIRENGDTPNETVSVIAATGVSCDELEGLLLSELSEVELLHLEEVKVQRGKLVGEFLSRIDESRLYAFDERAIEFSRLDLSTEGQAEDEGWRLMRQGLDFISETVKDLELLLLDMCPNLQECRKDCNHLPKLIAGFESIDETAEALNSSKIASIARETADLMGEMQSGGLLTLESNLELIANSLTLTKKAVRCYKARAELPDGLENELEFHRNLLKKDTAAYLEKHSPRNSADDGLRDKRLGDILVDHGSLSINAREEVIAFQQNQLPDKKIGEILVNEGIASVAEVRSALTAQEVSRTPQLGSNLIRIPEQKVGALFDLLGELIIMQSQQREDIQAVINGFGDAARLSNNMARMERVTRELQSITMSFRMVSVKQIFQKVLRVAMHTAKELNRDVRFELTGEDTEVDRSIVERLNDPLMHLIRNAISHGIEEDSDQRLASGKKAQGTVRMTASSKKGSVFIEVSDDGKGLDSQKILKKAIDKGLAESGKEYSEREIFNFIFLPGFSTQEEVNSISGRGVGMNVVEEEMKKIGGRVEIQSERGKGTCFTLKIPINMATINGFVVDINSQRYVLPTMSIKRIFKPEDEDWVSVRGHVEMVRNRGDLINLIPIGKILGSTFDLNDHMIMVLEYEGDVRALPVKEVIGKQEIVIKPLDSAFSHLGFLSGSTILGDGSAALILDVGSFFKQE